MHQKNIRKDIALGEMLLLNALLGSCFLCELRPRKDKLLTITPFQVELEPETKLAHS